MTSRVLFFILVLVVGLTGCDTEKVQQSNLVGQQNHFLQSIVLVEEAGTILQAPNLDNPAIQSAMSKMDQGIEKAFAVETEFLDQLDPLLAKYYRDKFISGVEQYRLGVESTNRDLQLKGLQLLSQWGEFWSRKRDPIKEKIENLLG
jgi:hypothetical protein